MEAASSAALHEKCLERCVASSQTVTFTTPMLPKGTLGRTVGGGVPLYSERSSC